MSQLGREGSERGTQGNVAFIHDIEAVDKELGGNTS